MSHLHHTSIQQPSPRSSFSTSRCTSPNRSSPSPSTQPLHRPTFVHHSTATVINSSPLHIPSPTTPALISTSSLPSSSSSSSTAVPLYAISAKLNSNLHSDHGDDDDDHHHHFKSAATLPLLSDESTSARFSDPLASHHRNLYNQRRTPESIDDMVPAGRTRSGEWREKVIPKEGGFGRILIAGWVITTVGFLVMIGLWRGELFTSRFSLHKTVRPSLVA